MSGVVESSSAEKCLQFCKDIPECQWFTFLDDFQVKFMFVFDQSPNLQKIVTMRIRQMTIRLKG